MLEKYTNRLWNLIKEKAISLAMVYDRDGNILWHRGRPIEGNNVFNGRGFSKTYILELINGKSDRIETDNVFLSVKEGMPESAVNLNLKSLMIFPISSHYFMYVDSGSKMSFSEQERGSIKTLSTLLGEIITEIQRNHSDVGLAGTSRETNLLREQILAAAIEDNTLLLTGETGVGKNHLAKAIHFYSGRPGSLVVVNTPSIPDHLFESELFGYKKGAFTDARENKKGLVDEAEKGTLLLDEISEVPLAFQSKLLKFIDTRTYHVVGDSQERTIDVRIVAATNKNLEKLVVEGAFREDLFYRLRVLDIEIPPLRERKIDIKALVQNFESKNYLRGKQIGEGFWDALYEHDWPGNVRELENVLIKAGVFGEDPITGEMIKKLLTRTNLKLNGSSKIDKIWAELKSGENFWDVVKQPYLKRDLNKEEVKEVLRRGLQQTNGKYIDLLPLFNLPRDRYQLFMDFLYKHKLKVK